MPLLPSQRAQGTASSHRDFLRHNLDTPRASQKAMTKKKYATVNGNCNGFHVEAPLEVEAVEMVAQEKRDQKTEKLKALNSILHKEAAYRRTTRHCV
ncbi:hypothetical protein E2562_015326 [Oryza meyeriana var. granulata]|uniref:Uncharacterized protein n=1 Tax=Oryza meyeriana var. granulata TaxID=110450 RepID=A0A6G1EJM9_9ORYZ|nr:hypothetical protein E2562_015326 [Oryza meyeriana var. granulata]